MSVGATVIALIALGILILWNKVLSKKGKIFQLIQGPLVAVVVGILFYVFTKDGALNITKDHLVAVPIPDGIDSFLGQFSFPNFAVITNTDIWITAFTIALVASLETLLCVEATDKLDPEKKSYTYQPRIIGSRSRKYDFRIYWWTTDYTGNCS